MKQHTERN